MKHRVSTAAFLCVALLLSATAAWASVPSLANSTVPAGIQLVGSTGGVPDFRGEAVFIIRDAGGTTLPGITVYVEFDSCMTPPQANKDMFIARTQPWAQMTHVPYSLVPGNQTPIAYAITDATGTARFRFLGKANAVPTGAGNPPSAGITTACVRIWLENDSPDPFASIRTYLGAYDQNGAGGVNAADQSLFLACLFGAYRSRADYNGSGTVTAADLSKLLQVQFGGGSSVSSAGAHD